MDTSNFIDVSMSLQQSQAATCAGVRYPHYLTFLHELHNITLYALTLKASYGCPA